MGSGERRQEQKGEYTTHQRIIADPHGSFAAIQCELSRSSGNKEATYFS
jgi:hypothetical protein